MQKAPDPPEPAATHSHIFCTFERGTFRVFRLDIFDKIFCVFPIGLICVKGKYLLLIRPVRYCLFLLSPKACIPVRRSYACWCKSFEYALFLLPKQNRLPYIEFSLKQSRLLPAHQDSTLGKYTFIVLCVTVRITPQTLFTAYVCSSLYSLSTSSGRSVGFFLEESALRHFISMSGYIHDTFYLQHTFKRITCVKVNDVLSNSQRLLWRVRTSHRCINPDSTPH